MKKLIFSLFLTALVFGQNTDKNTRYLNANDVLFNSYQATKQELRMILIQDSSSIVKNTDTLKVNILGGSSARQVSELSDFIKGDDTCTLAACYDTVSTMYFGGRWLYGEIEITDTGSTYTDSLVVQKYDTLGLDGAGEWTTKAVGLKNLYTNQMENTTGTWYGSSVTVIIPGAATTKKYLINDPYPGTWRIMRFSPRSYTTNHKVWITWRGKN